MADVKWEDVGGDARNSGRAGSTGVADVAGSWATPLIVRSSGPDELVVAFALRLMAFQPQTGEPLWTCDGPNIGALQLSLFWLRDYRFERQRFAQHGHRRQSGRSRQRDGHAPSLDSVSRQGVHWRRCNLPGAHLPGEYDPGIAECRDLGTGKIVWEKRLTGTGARNASWSSPVLAGDRLYVANQNAEVFILRASPKYERVASNSIGGEPMNASLAVSRGDIFIRTDKQLWCISKK